MLFVLLAPRASDKEGFAVSRLATENVKTRLGMNGKSTSNLTRTISTSSSSKGELLVVWSS